jgi:hypothetical protein
MEVLYHVLDYFIPSFCITKGPFTIAALGLVIFTVVALGAIQPHIHRYEVSFRGDIAAGT